jgi:hypothetical protein
VVMGGPAICHSQSSRFPSRENPIGTIIRLPGSKGVSERVSTEGRRGQMAAGMGSRMGRGPPSRPSFQERLLL